MISHNDKKIRRFATTLLGLDGISSHREQTKKTKKTKTKELFLAKNRYKMIFKNNAAGIYVVDEDRNILSANNRIYEIFGYTKKEIVGQNFSLLHVNQKGYEDFANYYISIENDSKVKVEYQLKRKDGEVIWCELFGNSILLKNQKKVFIWSIIDINERKKVEKENQHLKELYATLKQCSQAIVHSNNQKELFDKICKDIANFSGVKLAWIGVENKEKGFIEPTSFGGEGVGYLRTLTISLDENSPSSKRPAGIAFREDRVVWIQDFQNDPATELWHQQGAYFGWRSVGALPLHQQGRVIGVFVLYADRVDMFSDTIKNLLVGMVRDIDYALDGYQKDAELLRLSEAVEQTPNSIVITDLESNIIYVNSAFMNITGYTLEEVLGQNPRVLNSGKTPRSVYDDMWEHISKGKSWRGEFINKRKDGSEYIEAVSISPIMNAQGVIVNYMSIKEDITEKKQAEERIYRLANFDHLTGLPSRIPLEDHFEYLLSLAKRSETPFGVMFLDLDGFKEINDTLGHKVGDILLVETAKRFQSLMREVDVVSRSGGDEFIIVLPDTDMLGCENVAKKLLETVAKPYYVDEYELNISVSIGIALYPADGTDMETLSKNADTAMYQAKAQGRNGYCFFTESMQVRSLHNLRLSNALRHAVWKNELQVYYQPQISIEDGQIVGAEALIRWFHPELGYIAPLEFVPVAEESGQILAIGEWVLRTTAEYAKKRIEEGLSPIVFSVNLSAYQFKHPSLPELVSQILLETGLDAKYLELELTESMAMHDPLGAVNTINNLYERGVRLSIDDFGTGYSSLSYLKKFKVYKLKIDRSFVCDISTDPDDRAIVKAIIAMAKSLGMITIAEGVETKDQLDYLKEQGCEEAQGYYYCRPLNAEKFEEFVKKYNLRNFKKVGNNG